MTTAGDDMISESCVMIPMRDGVRLSADIYRPSVSTQFPVILIRTPYDASKALLHYGGPNSFVCKGYAVIVQDCRGRFRSEGTWTPFFCEIDDGFDTVEWAAAQPWANGKVGMIGRSGVGQTQWATAIAKPPSLVTIIPATTSTNLHDSWVYRKGGVFDLNFSVGWSILVSENRAQRLELDIPELREVWEATERFFAAQYTKPAVSEDLFHKVSELQGAFLKSRPLRQIEALRNAAPWFTDWLDHPTYDSYWARINPAAHFHSLDLPVIHQAGWFDVFLPGAIDGYLGMSAQAQSERARKAQILIIDASAHVPADSTNPNKTGEVDFGEGSRFDLHTFQLRWLDWWLKGEESGVLNEPPIKLFVMGDNVWREEWEWPLARTQWTRIHLHSQGLANSAAGDGRLSLAPAEDEPPDQFIYDPRRPVPTLGGAPIDTALPKGTGAGPRDQRDIELRTDVLVYTGDILFADCEVTGPVKVELWATTSAPDTDFTAKLVDVYPDGRAMSVCDGILCTRYRHSRSDPTLVVPGSINSYLIDLSATSWVFKTGHRIRLDISSSNFPHYTPNSNTGHSFDVDAEVDFALATQEIFHDRLHPSAVILPVIARDTP
jgi:putative CocE/NonD family hydrolase